MEFRKAMKADQTVIIKIIQQAQDYFRDQGIDQWQNGYPNPETVRRDITEENAYVLVSGKAVIGTVSVLFSGEDAYRDLYGGSWFSDGDYAVIHRIAIENGSKGAGFSSEIFRRVEELCLEKDIHSIRVDTHRDNLAMQKALEKNGFSLCGGIFLADGSPRVAFEKMVGHDSPLRPDHF